MSQSTFLKNNPVDVTFLRQEYEDALRDASFWTGEMGSNPDSKDRDTMVGAVTQRCYGTRAMKWSDTVATYRPDGGVDNITLRGNRIGIVAVSNKENYTHLAVRKDYVDRAPIDLIYVSVRVSWSAGEFTSKVALAALGYTFRSALLESGFCGCEDCIERKKRNPQLKDGQLTITGYVNYLMPVSKLHPWDPMWTLRPELCPL